MIIRKNHHKKVKLFAASVLAGFIIVSGWLFTQTTSNAADLRKFNPGNIMSDAVMSNSSAMNVQQIQNFLDSKNPCNNTNTHMAAWYPHLKYSIKDGRFVCMAKDTFNGKSAAQIIWQAAQDYNINPQVLIVLLEKEQGLITDTWPNHVQYRTATGYGCPDTAPCDTQYYGLENQLRMAASMFRSVLNGGWTNYPVGNTYVQYHPNSACGGSVINIQNRATSALYRYTPYQPNQAALNAGYGLGDGCSAYGNRNFYALFTDWFGNPTSDGMVSMKDPRWMKLSRDTQKLHASTGEKFGPILVKDRQIQFIDKIRINGRWLLRTAYDKRHGNYHGIPLDDLSEIAYEPVLSTYPLVTINNTIKEDPIRNKKFSSVNSMVAIRMADKITLNGTTYFRTVYEKNLNMNGSIKESDLDNFKFFELLKPRRLVTKTDINPRDVLTGELGSVIPKNSVLHFGKRITVSNVLYVQPDILSGTNFIIRYSDLMETQGNIHFSPMVRPRQMKLSTDTQKKQAENGEEVGPMLMKDRQIEFIDKIYSNGEWLLRTAYDKRHGNPYGIPLSRLSEL